MSRKWFFSVCSLFLSISNTLFGEDYASYDPLYNGTLLAFFPTNADPGRLEIQPFLYITKEYGFYKNNWSLQKQTNINELKLLLLLETGITRWLDATLIVDSTYDSFKNKHSLRYGDTNFLLGIQLSRDKKGTSLPDIRLVVGETFPTGKYKNLDPNKLAIDGSGNGSYETSLILVVAKTFYTFPQHPFNWNLNLYYVQSSKAEVSNFNVYGGGYGTKGPVRPGNQFIANLAFQYSLNRNWALGIDANYLYQDESLFSGKKGVKKDGTAARVGLPLTERVSLAPCLEYSFNSDFSLAGGAWFTVAGKNTQAFTSYIINVFYYF